MNVYVYKMYFGEFVKFIVIFIDESGNFIWGWVLVGGENVIVFFVGFVNFEFKLGEYIVLVGVEGCFLVEEDVKFFDGEERILIIKFRCVEYYFKVFLERDVLIVILGSGGSVVIIIKNFGFKDDDYRVIVEGFFEGWSYIFS